MVMIMIMIMCNKHVLGCSIWLEEKKVKYCNVQVPFLVFFFGIVVSRHTIMFDFTRVDFH